MKYAENTTFWFVFCKSDLLLQKLGDELYTVPTGDTPPTEVKPWTTIHDIEVPMMDGMKAKAYTIDMPVADQPPFEMCGLRASYYKLPRVLYLAAGKCQEIMYWDQNTRFCGVCGGQMKMHTNISKRCEQCGKEVWPQLATAIIVLIRRGEEVLLVHANNFKRNFFGLVAGFVETGESLEEAVVREVTEEVGINIANIQYFASQPWPYPSGLMVGFTADYVSGEIKLQRSELAAGGWYNRHNLPELPEKLSIARHLIDSWLASFDDEKQ